MDPLHDVELAGETYHRQHLEEYGHETPNAVDLNLAAELGLLEGLQILAAHADTQQLPPEFLRIYLASSAQGSNRGNPVEWRSWRARTIAVYNNNPFPVFVGQGAGGGGNAGTAAATVPAYTLAILPIEEEIYSIGTAAANVASAEALVGVWRFAQALPPQLYDLAVTGGAAPGATLDNQPPVVLGGDYRATPPTYNDLSRAVAQFDARGNLRVAIAQPGGSGSPTFIAGSTFDGFSAGSLSGLVTPTLSGLYDGASMRLARTPIVFKIVNVTIVAGTPQTIWTPAAGKKFRLMGYAITPSAATYGKFIDGAAGEIHRTEGAAANTGSWRTPGGYGNGQLSATANNALQLDAGAGATVMGVVFGTEE